MAINVYRYIQDGLAAQAIPEILLQPLTDLIGFIIMMLIASMVHLVVKHQVLGLIHKSVSATKNQWDDVLVEHRVFVRFALLAPLIALWFLTPHLLLTETVFSQIILTLVKMAICIQVAIALRALINAIYLLYIKGSPKHNLPVNAALQLVKLAIYLVAGIFATAILLDKSPVYLLSGFGALTAVLLLVFQDTIKGLVASIQISANRMLAPGDWIEMPKYGADGDVVEIGLNTVKVENFDKTITTIPTYALTTESFKNWRNMYLIGARRIKRSLFIDVSSIHFCTDEDLDLFAKNNLIKPYIDEKKHSIEQFNQAAGITKEDILNSRQLTNLGTFRHYITAYLAQHHKIHQDMTRIVRQLPSEGQGLPIELYCFTNDHLWANYESIQADIFDHLYAIAPHFGLRVFQHPTGHDWQKMNASK